MPSSGTTATATIAPMAGEGMSSSRAVPKSSSSSVPTPTTSDGSWVREPAWSIAAVREVDEPTAKPPEAPAAMLPSPKASRSRFGLVG